MRKSFLFAFLLSCLVLLGATWPIPSNVTTGTGDLLYSVGGKWLDNLEAVATGQVLTSGGADAAPAWSASPTLTGITTTNFTTTNLTVNGVTVDEVQQDLAGEDWFNICGDADTVNNNTVYYGPNVTLLASSGNGQTCDINAAGNTTEATADAPIYTNQAVQVAGMTCRNEADANADISFTLRTAEGATTPSVTCTISDGERDCVADVQTTTAIAAGATVAIAAASTSDVGAANGFLCNVAVRY